ncbi:helix-turn-helix domain-containing protein [Pontimicrobium aquaticum]|uniref:Helix-turn-helix domain-containing protein n=1 Tax=Pontimicrobium aquaticum TaxID=2565367 RepID=A0A4U0EZ88_9FLAO|nr:helix-turn-helix domain-containing protein [Pontimicrobium aquaticum]TJY37363.1 helix-turn-helix domain-containing protein [Pontimicrobium aquaticum]
MTNNHLAIKLKALRNQKGMSQEVLADESGLSLRTIQRIENGETNPTGDSLKRLANSLNASPDELIDWAIKEDNSYLVYLNLSTLTFLFFPLLGIIVPFILWTSKKDKIKGINTLGRDLINFEITWTMLMFSIPFSIFLLSKVGILDSFSLSTIFATTVIMYIINVLSVLFNTFRINNEKEVKYYPRLTFLK